MKHKRNTLRATQTQKLYYAVSISFFAFLDAKLRYFF